MDDGAQGGQVTAQFGDDLAAVVLLAAVAVAVDGEQHDGFDLLEAVQDAAGAEVGGAGGPHGADGGRGQQGDDGLRDVGQVAADPVARADAERAEFGGEGADLAAQLGPGHRARFVGLVDMEEGGLVRAVGGGAQGVLGVVEGGSGEPLGAGHRAVAEHARVRRGEADVEPLGDGFPERLEVVDGPLVQCGIAAFGGRAVMLGGPGLEPGDACLGDPLGIGLPERLGVRGRHGGGSRAVRVVCVGPRTAGVCA